MILVTGADGIVGRRLCSHLQESAAPFIPLTHRRKSHTLPESLVVDLASDHAAISAYCDKITAIVHLAAAVPHSAAYPDNKISAEYTRRMDRNVRTLQLKSGVPVVYMSTCGLYDRSTPDIKYEDNNSQLKVTSPYFAAKADGEALFLSDGITTVLRLSAPIGPGLKPGLVVSRFITTARENGVIKIWGTGSREQDFVDTADIANLIIQVLKAPRNTIINAASGLPVTMAKLAEIAISVAGNGSLEIAEKSDPHEGETARYSIARATSLYNWKPAHTLTQSLASLMTEDFRANA